MAEEAELHQKPPPGYRFSGMGESFTLPLSYSHVRDLSPFKELWPYLWPPML